MSYENLEDFFKKNLLFKCQYLIDNKIIKEGKFYYFNFSFFYINIYIQNFKNKNVNLKIPFPFKYKFVNDKEVIFDYKITSLLNDIDFINCVYSFGKIKNKFFDKILHIKFYE